MRTSPLRIQPRLRPLQQQRPRRHRTAGSVRQENHGASVRRRRRSKRPSQENITQGPSPGAAPSTPLPSAVVRELRERRDPTMQRVRVEYLWCAVGGISLNHNA